jgi:glycosyltransferase involved in cell wall biosynthesis
VKLATLANASVVHTQRWVEHFRGRGHDVRLYSLEPAPPGLASTALPSLPLPGLLRYPLAWPRLARELAAFAPDLVDAHYVPNYGVLAALAGRHPLSIAAWGSDLLLAARRDPWQRARARFALTRADLVLCDAENLAEAARAAGAPADRVRALPWGVDRARFRPGPERERGLMLSTRMHEDVYDLPTLIEAAALVLARHPHASLVLAGGGSRRRALEALATARLPAGRYRFVGMLAPEALAGWLARAELYLSASRSDSTSQSLLEAMAAGALPVVSDLAGNREWLGEGEGGRLFPVGDAAGFARAADAAFADSAWAAAARARNTAVIAARGDWHVNLARIEALFTALAAGQSLPAAGAA